MSDWNSKQYLKFEAERTQPSVDLISRLNNLTPSRVLDIGCGPGNSTAMLSNKFNSACIIGVDSSDDMLKKAREDHTHIDFQKCFMPDDMDCLEGKFDLIFSNACIHWIQNQYGLIRAVMDKLNKGGAFAVQIPLVQRAPFYKMLGSVVLEDKWRDKLVKIKSFHNLTPEGYYDALSEFTEDITMWQTTYYHIVKDRNAIIEWYKGSGLRPYLDALDETEGEQFQNDILYQMKKMYPAQKNNNIILKMPRLFFVAVKN